MTTVFIILLIVINLGKGLIVLVNKYAPEETTGKKRPPVQSANPGNNQPADRPANGFSGVAANPFENTGETGSRPAGILSHAETAAIIAAVSLATAGQGKVTRIEKI